MNLKYSLNTVMRDLISSKKFDIHQYKSKDLLNYTGSIYVSKDDWTTDSSRCVIYFCGGGFAACGCNYNQYQRMNVNYKFIMFDYPTLFG